MMMNFSQAEVFSSVFLPLCSLLLVLLFFPPPHSPVDILIYQTRFTCLIKFDNTNSGGYNFSLPSLQRTDKPILPSTGPVLRVLNLCFQSFDSHLTSHIGTLSYSIPLRSHVQYITGIQFSITSSHTESTFQLPPILATFRAIW